MKYFNRYAKVKKIVWKTNKIALIDAQQSIPLVSNTKRTKLQYLSAKVFFFFFHEKRFCEKSWSHLDENKKHIIW